MKNPKLPDKTFLRIDALYAFIAEHPGSGEGIMAFMTQDGTMMPMIGSDLTRVESLKPIADKISRIMGITYKICKFTNREIFEL